MKMLGVVVVGVVLLAGIPGSVSGGQMRRRGTARIRFPGIQQPKTGVARPG